MARLVCFILIFALFLIFIGLNLGNGCDVNFGFYVFTDAPVYITALVSFCLGMLCTIPILAFKGKKPPKEKRAKPEKKKKKTSEAPKDTISGTNGTYGID